MAYVRGPCTHKGVLMRRFAAILVTTLALLSLTSAAEACSRVLWTTKQANVVGRNMDWFEDTKTNLWVFPRGIERDGLTGKNTLRWASKYGSVVASMYDIGTTDGMNEKGLVVNELWLAESDYGKRDDSLPGLSLGLWPQYYLDNFATVKEAVRFTETMPFQVVTGAVGTSGRTGATHLALADKSGDSAIIEYINGKPRIWRGKQTKVMTNSPTFDKQLENLKQYQGFGGDKYLPGSGLAADRFVRATYYSSNLPPPRTERQAVGNIWSVMHNVAAPFGTRPTPNSPNLSATQWIVVADMTHDIYYYGSTMSPTVFWVDLKKLDLKKGAPVLKLDVVNNPDRLGDATAGLSPSKPFTFQVP